MAERSIESSSTDETFEWGRLLGLQLRPGDFVGLSGELGAGKTLFSRGVALGAEAPLEDVSSPTYAILQTYSGRLPLHHADLYRLKNDAELYETGFFDVLDGNGATLVEWIDRVPSAAPADALLVHLEIVSGAKRRLSIRATGPGVEALFGRWLPSP